MVREYPVNSGYQHSNKRYHDVDSVQPAVVGFGRLAVLYQLYSPGQGPVVEGKEPVGLVEC